MKQKVVALGLALSLLLLGGCKKTEGTAQNATASTREEGLVISSTAENDHQTQTDSNGQGQQGTDATDDQQGQQTPPATQPEDPTVTEPEKPKVITAASGRLQVVESGRYTGLYPEDGTDESVTDVAVLLVKNISDETCQYCALEYTVDGKQASFAISELPPWSSAWVLEKNRVTVGEKAEFVYVSDTAAFRQTERLPQSDVSVTGGEGKLTVTNNTETDYGRVAVYYKLTHTDGNYLGGIAYRVTVDNLSAGASATVTAGHFYTGACEVVGVFAEG